MPIPECEGGFLPDGIFDCSLEEIGDRFGALQEISVRRNLYRRLQDYLEEVRSTGLVHAVIIDGSFVTDKPEPNDIDIILLLRREHDFQADLRPFQYNALSRRRVNRKWGFDVLLARDGSTEQTEYLAFFAQVRGRPDVTKGLLRVML